MSKLIKYVTIFLSAFFVLCTTSCYATNINMNLTDGNTDDTNTTQSNSMNTATTNTNTNSNTDTTTTVGGVSSTKEEGLTMGHILNILLIVVGIVLILLGIAILIRLKS